MWFCDVVEKGEKRELENDNGHVMVIQCHAMPSGEGGAGSVIFVMTI